MGLEMIEIVSATKRSSDDFARNSALGISLHRLKADRSITAYIASNNSQPLATIYKSRIEATSDADTLVFVHDDVWIEDFFLSANLEGALKTFDVVGVAGALRRYPGQPAWHSLAGTMQFDMQNISGAVAHGPRPFGRVVYYGKAPAECQLLDGVFLAAKKATLLNAGVRFDPQFAFHFYDLDFCRTAQSNGLRLGTWTIPLTHQSKGNFESSQWSETLAAYRAKWGD